LTYLNKKYKIPLTYHVSRITSKGGFKGSESGSCGSSRFGCWSCTVVKKEKSLSSLIENGEEWLKPLQEYRQFLLESSKKPELRMEKVRKGKIVKGGFKLEFRQVLLEKLLEVERQVGVKLIREDELVEIQKIWMHDKWKCLT